MRAPRHGLPRQPGHFGVFCLAVICGTVAAGLLVGHVEDRRTPATVQTVVDEWPTVAAGTSRGVFPGAQAVLEDGRQARVAEATLTRATLALVDQRSAPRASRVTIEVLRCPAQGCSTIRPAIVCAGCGRRTSNR